MTVKKAISKKEKCSYHLCQKESKTSTCKYCLKKFCNTHFLPFAPGRPQWDCKNSEEYQYMNEWRKGNYHPCANYYSKSQEEKKEKLQKELKTLDTLLKTSRKNEIKSIEPNFKYYQKTTSKWPLVVIGLLFIVLVYHLLKLYKQL